MNEPRILAFRVRLSQWACTERPRPVVSVLRARGHRVNAYVDNFAAAGRRGHPSSAAEAEATAGRVERLSLSRSLELFVHSKKVDHVGKSVLAFLGFSFQMRRKLLLLPPARLSTLFAGARALLTSACCDGRRVRHRTLQRFTGEAVSFSLAVPSARFILRRLKNA